MYDMIRKLFKSMFMFIKIRHKKEKKKNAYQVVNLRSYLHKRRDSRGLPPMRFWQKALDRNLVMRFEVFKKMR